MEKDRWFSMPPPVITQWYPGKNGHHNHWREKSTISREFSYGNHGFSTSVFYPEVLSFHTHHLPAPPQWPHGPTVFPAASWNKTHDPGQHRQTLQRLAGLTVLERIGTVGMGMVPRCATFLGETNYPWNYIIPFLSWLKNHGSYFM